MFKYFADKKGATMSQISLAWMIKKSLIVIIIPGIRSDSLIEEIYLQLM